MKLKQMSRVDYHFLYDASPDAVFRFATCVMSGNSIHDRVFADDFSRDTYTLQGGNALPYNSCILLKNIHDDFVENRFEHLLI